MTNSKNITELTKLVRYNILTSTTAAGSGHPSSSLSGTELLTTLFFDGYFHYDFENPSYELNDRLIFSKGHAAPLLYSLYQAAGVISHEELLTLRKFDSVLEGHPTPRFKYIDVATGSLGQGLSAGLGMALGIKLKIKSQDLHLTREPKVFVVLGDSEMAEGQVWEAIQLASYYKVNNLIGIIDVNRLGQRGVTMLGWDMKAYQARIEAFGWKAVVIEGNDLGEVKKAFETASQSTDAPVMIIAKTKKGAGISLLSDLDNWHGKPLPADKLDIALAELGDFDRNIHGEVKKPEQASLAESTTQDSEKIEYAPDSKVATREAYGDALVYLGQKHENLVVLDAETSNSTFADKFKAPFPERFFEMFIAEQNMVTAGLGFSKVGFKPFISSFAAFFTRAFDQIRMAQYSEGNITIVGSHAGVSIGTDGSSQMALEDLAMMRSILHSIVVYPADALSTVKLAELIYSHKGISYMRLTREKTPLLYDSNEKFEIGGSKVLRHSKNDSAVIVAAGITVHEALKAADKLAENGVSVAVIDAYSVKPLDEKTITYYAQKTGHVVVVEDHYPYGGLGEAVKNCLSGREIKISHLAVNEIPRSGTPEELLHFEQIDAESIAKLLL